MHISEEELAACKSAIELEKEGHKLFGESARESGNKLGKEVFEFLASEELKDIGAIESFQKSRRGGDPSPRKQWSLNRRRSRYTAE